MDRSWARVSARSSLRPPRALAQVRAICATSMVWVSRLRKWSEARLVKTLGLAGETAEGTRLDDAFAVALERGAELAEWRGVYTGPEKIVRITGHRASMQVDWHIQIRV